MKQEVQNTNKMLHSKKNEMKYFFKFLNFCFTVYHFPRHYEKRQRPSEKSVTWNGKSNVSIFRRHILSFFSEIE